MSAGTELRIFMVVLGLIILGATIISLAKRHMTESFCIAWGVLAAMFIFAGIVLQPSQWNNYISWSGLLLILFSVLILLFGAFFLSVRVSYLTREVRELVIQVSLLNQENELIMGEFMKTRTESEMRTDEEETLIRH